MAYVFTDISKAVLRSGKAESTNLLEGKFVKHGTTETDLVVSSAATDNVCGIVVQPAGIGSPAVIAEAGAYVPVKCSEAIAIQKRLFLASDGQRVTDVVPTSAGTYISVGISKSITDGANKMLTMLLDIKEVTIVE
jgi:hypothetical protein